MSNFQKMVMLLNRIIVYKYEKIGTFEETDKTDANGKKLHKPYKKAEYEGDGIYSDKGETRHHAEQRAKTSAKDNKQEIVGLCATKGCCNKCGSALGDDINKVPENNRKM